MLISINILMSYRQEGTSASHHKWLRIIPTNETPGVEEHPLAGGDRGDTMTVISVSREEFQNLCLRAAATSLMATIENSDTGQLVFDVGDHFRCLISSTDGTPEVSSEQLYQDIHDGEGRLMHSPTGVLVVISLSRIVFCSLLQQAAKFLERSGGAINV